MTLDLEPINYNTKENNANNTLVEHALVVGAIIDMYALQLV